MTKKGIVLFIDTVHPMLFEGLEKAGYECQWVYEAPLHDLMPKLRSAKGIVLRSRFTINDSFLDNCTQLEWIARSGSGMENIDVKEAEKRGIKVFNSPEGNAPAVAEHVVALVFGLFNKIVSGDHEVRQGKWNREAHRGIELSGRKVGLIGYGHTGKATARLLSALGARIFAYDKYLSNYSDEYAAESTLEELQNTCEVVSFHVPYNEETHYYFNSSFLAECKNPIWLINTSRGKVIETSAVNEGLNSGAILGAGLDVLEFESSSFSNEAIESKPSSFDALTKHSNVILTPHVAGWTEESYVRLSSVLLDKLLD
jgi:D-3-phosphoglycerate dehydrogenase